MRGKTQSEPGSTAWGRVKRVEFFQADKANLRAKQGASNGGGWSEGQDSCRSSLKLTKRNCKGIEGGWNRVGG